MARYLQYKPQEYQSTFVPNYEKEYAEMFDKLQQKQDSSEAALASKYDEVLKAKYTDAAAKQQALEDIKGYTKKLQEETQGNYATNLSKVMSTVNKIQEHPFNSLNAIAQDQIKIAEEARMRIPNILESRDPYTTPLRNEDGSWKTPEQLKYSYENLDAVHKTFMDQWGAFGDIQGPMGKAMPIPGLPDHYKVSRQIGLTPDQIVKGDSQLKAPSFAPNNIETTKQFLESSPRLAAVLQDKYGKDTESILREAGELKYKLAIANLQKGPKEEVYQYDALGHALKQLEYNRQKQPPPTPPKEAFPTVPGVDSKNDVTKSSEALGKLNVSSKGIDRSKYDNNGNLKSVKPNDANFQNFKKELVNIEADYNKKKEYIDAIYYSPDNFEQKQNRIEDLNNWYKTKLGELKKYDPEFKVESLEFEVPGQKPKYKSKYKKDFETDWEVYNSDKTLREDNPVLHNKAKSLGLTDAAFHGVALEVVKNNSRLAGEFYTIPTENNAFIKTAHEYAKQNNAKIKEVDRTTGKALEVSKEENKDIKDAFNNENFSPVVDLAHGRLLTSNPNKANSYFEVPVNTSINLALQGGKKIFDFYTNKEGKDNEENSIHIPGIGEFTVYNNYQALVPGDEIPVTYVDPKDNKIKETTTSASYAGQKPVKFKDEYGIEVIYPNLESIKEELLTRINRTTQFTNPDYTGQSTKQEQNVINYKNKSKR